MGANAVTKTESTQLADFSKASTIQKFASLASGGKLDRLSPEQQTAYLVAVGQHVGVHAELGEVVLYQGRFYITIDGRIRIAHATGLLDGIQVRPATAMEFQNYGADTGDTLWVCSVFKKGARRAFTGWGHVRKDDRNPVAKTHPRELAKKRAKYDALRTAFPAREAIGALQLHTDYAADVEEQAPAGVPAIASAEYDEMPDDISVLGEEIAALAASGINPYGEDDGTLPPTSAPELTDADIARMDEEQELALNDRRPSRRRVAQQEGR